MRFDEVVVPLDAFGPGPAARRVEGPEAGGMREELIALEAKYKGLQALVAELLATNQRLRGELAVLQAGRKTSESATHRQPRLDR
jgi:hypothetical protein